MTQSSRSASARRAGLARVAGRTPEQRSADAKRASDARWARWRAERGIQAPAETSANRTPADGLDAYLDEVLREYPSWSLAKARREAAIRQRKAAADLAWATLKARNAANEAPKPRQVRLRDEDDE